MFAFFQFINFRMDFLLDKPFADTPISLLYILDNVYPPIDQSNKEIIRKVFANVSSGDGYPTQERKQKLM